MAWLSARSLPDIDLAIGLCFYLHKHSIETDVYQYLQLCTFQLFKQVYSKEVRSN